MSQLTTTARFDCPLCKKDARVTIDVPEVDWCVEPLSDSLSEDEGEMECDKCGQFFNIKIQNSPAGCFIELLDHPEVQVDAEDAPFSSDDPQENEWLNNSIPLRPYEIYIDNYHHLGEVLAECPRGEQYVFRQSAAIIQRMIFAETISSMEAYLGDILQLTVLATPKAMQRLAIKDRELSAEKVALSVILDNPNVVSDKIRGYLKGLLYHNLPKVEAIFKIALNINIFPDKDLKVRLLGFVKIRHDVVHRSGKGKDGEEHSFPATWVMEVMENVRSFIENIERSLADARIESLSAPRETKQPE